ncbi:MAG TPA: cobalt transporter CbiM [Armatimonadota bacterium]
MHIPDGYLSPATQAVAFAAAAPFWTVAGRTVGRHLKAAAAPRIGIFAAFSFVIMMFNVPLPGGTSGHAVGGALMAIALGPWEAVLGVSAALALQAIFFGDGGIGALGANCLNMAVVLPLVAYGAFRGLRRLGLTGAPAAAVAGYVGLMASAFCVALELGIQPTLFHDIHGAPLYNAYGLAVTLPAMLIPHALVAAPVEAIITGLVYAYLEKTQPSMLRDGGLAPSRLRPLWVGLLALALLSPLGLLASNTAFGEWGVGEIRARLGFVPAGIARAGAAKAPLLADYTVPGASERMGYVLSALIGVALLAAIALVVGAVASRRAVRAGGVNDHQA